MGLNNEKCNDLNLKRRRTFLNSKEEIR